MTVMEHVLTYHQMRLACYPFKPASKKAPFDELRYHSWGQYKNSPQSHKEAELLFADHPDANIAIIGGMPSDNIFFIDCDNGQQFENITRLLDGYGIMTPIVQRDGFSPGDPHDGGGCVWLKSPVTIRTRNIDDLGQVRGQGAYVLAPPSVHPTGSTYRFLGESSEIFRLPTLDAIPELQLVSATITENSQKIPRPASNLLSSDPQAISHYATRSEAEAAVVASLYRAGFSFDMILFCFLTHPAAGKFSELYRQKPDNALRWLTLTYQNVRAELDSHQNEATTLAKNLTAWAIGKPWPGRCGTYDRSVYLAHLQIVHRCGNSESYAASARDLAEIAGLSWQAVTKANRRLAKAGLIELSDRATPELAHRWSLVGGVSKVVTPSHEKVTDCQLLILTLGHDLFRWSGLNKTGAEIYAKLEELGDATPTELAEATGRGIATVKRKLARMAAYQVAKSVNGRWRLCDDANLDEIAHVAGVTGLSDRQRQRHVQERRTHRLSLVRQGR